MPGHGCTPNDPARCAHERPAQPLIRRMGGAVPKGATSLAQFRTDPRLNQGGDESCTAHAVALGVWGSCAAAGKPLPAIPSQAFQWAGSKSLDVVRVPNADGSLPKFGNVGVQSVSAMLALGTIGFVPMGALVPGRFSDCGDPTWELPSDLAQHGAQSLVTGEYSLDPTADDFEVSIALAIDAGLMVYIGVSVGQAYQAWRGGGALCLPEVNATGHAIILDSYVTTATGERQYGSPGSYGNGAAVDGVWQMMASWVKVNTFDCYPLAVAGVHYA